MLGPGTLYLFSWVPLPSSEGYEDTGPDQGRGEPESKGWTWYRYPPRDTKVQVSCQRRGLRVG